MKNNTQLIMETWRRFLSEGEDPMDGRYPGQDEPGFESGTPVEDSDMMSMSVDDSFDSDAEVAFDPVTQSGSEDFEMNVASIRELIEERPGMSDDEFLRLRYTQEEIDEARAQHQEEMPDRMQGMDDFDSYDSAAAGEELASLGPIDDEPMGDY